MNRLDESVHQEHRMNDLGIHHPAAGVDIAVTSDNHHSWDLLPDSLLGLIASPGACFTGAKRASNT